MLQVQILSVRLTLIGYYELVVLLVLECIYIILYHLIHFSQIKTSLHTFAGASVGDGLSHVSVEALFAVVTVASSGVVSAVEANSSAPAS